MIDLRSSAELRAAESVQRAALHDGVLMHRAATALAIACAGLLKDARGAVVGSHVVVLAGSGDNGGDALFAAAALAARGCGVDAILVCERAHEAGLAAFRRAGGAVHRSDAIPAGIIDRADLFVDGIIGIGGSGGLRPEAAALAKLVHVSGVLVVAVDVPSGVDADSGAVTGAAISADVTVTFGAVKPGLVLAPGAQHCGAVLLVDIGLKFDTASLVRSLESIDVAAFLAEPAADAYKYSRGVVGVAAGSAAYPGAALLAVSAARRGSVGMVRFLDRADGVAPVVVSHFPDVVVDGSSPDDQERVGAWACGPGFTGSAVDALTVRAVLAASVPVILDAGALAVVATDADVRDSIAARAARGLVTVLTPHDGEFARLQPGLLAEAGDRLTAARRAAAALHAIVVLKGPGTIIAAPDGACFIDTQGTADLGTAGSGDVLTGLVSALLASAWANGQRESDDLLEATAAAVWLHGTAGRIAAAHAVVVATDVADAIPASINLARFGSETSS